MCFGGGGAAKPTVSASDTVNQVQAPVTREPWGPNYQVHQRRAKEGVGVRGNLAKASHTRNKRKLTDPKTISTKLGGSRGTRTTHGTAPGFTPIASFKSGVAGLLGEVEKLF